MPSSQATIQRFNLIISVLGLLFLDSATAVLVYERDLSIRDPRILGLYVAYDEICHAAVPEQTQTVIDASNLQSASITQV